MKLAFPWGQAGTILENAIGPDTWQTELLEEIGREVRTRKFNGVDPVRPVRIAVSSGHGVGKTSMAAWITLWLLSTRPFCQGSITANTFTQLETKTWAAIQKWKELSITSHWFEATGDRMYHVDAKSAWSCKALTARAEASEGFAGQHAASSSSFYIFDEASAIPDKIFEVAEGGLSDGEPFIVILGNPTRNSGAFHRAVFGSDRNLWNHRSIDSRSSSITNKQQIEEWVTQFGEDSDFVRVRVRGLAPRASDLQYIDSDRVFNAQQRELLPVLPDEPLVVGVDVARGGADNSVIRFRRGLDARSIAPIRVPGEECRDSMRMVSLIGQVMETEYGGVKPAMAFVDGSSMGGPILDRLKQLGHKNVIEVQFGASSPNPKFANMRAFMWSQSREWLLRGCIPKDAQLESDLIGPGYKHDKQDRLLLESKEDMKKRGLGSPDDGDALALTFAAPVLVKPKKTAVQSYRGADGWLA